MTARKFNGRGQVSQKREDTRAPFVRPRLNVAVAWYLTRGIAMRPRRLVDARYAFSAFVERVVGNNDDTALQ